MLALFLPHKTLLISLGAITTAFVTWEVIRFTAPNINQWIVSHLGIILKNEEKARLTGNTYLLLASLVVFLLFEKYVAITALLFLSIGDLMATVIGERFGRRKIFNKSWEDSLACLVACLLIGAVMARLSPTVTLPVTLAGGISATVAELLPIPVNDNLTIPLFSAGMMTLVTLYFG